jgi:tetratricopeptide (TPR) repeat protein
MATWKSSKKHVAKKNVPKRVPITVDNNHEDFSLIWLDEKNDRSEVQCRLRYVINYLKLFDNVDKCIKYLLSITEEKIFFIISGVLAESIIPRIHTHPQVERIYIFCHHRLSDDSLASAYGKISGVFTNNDSLLTRLKDDLRVSSNNLLFTSIFTSEKSIHDLDHESATFIWFPILLETMIRMPATASAKEDLLQECQTEYIDNESEQQMLLNFRQNYKPADAISWYTRDCFLYRLLNKAFRSQNILTIFKFRFFLADIHRQLETLHSNYIETLPTDKNTSTFRGQSIGNEELLKLQNNVGKLISINTYFSTTTDSQIAFSFAGDGEPVPFLESVLFEIELERTAVKSARPFAKLGDASFITHENELLFSPGTVFKIEFVEDYNISWHIKLVLVNKETTKEMDRITEFLRHEGDNPSPLASLGYFLWKISDYDKAEFFFSMALDELGPSDHTQASVILNNLGLLYSDRGYYRQALKYYEKSLKREMKNRLPNQADVATTMNNMGIIYANRERYTTAMKFYKQALKMRLEIVHPKPVDIADIATTYSNIGLIYAERQLFSRAIINQEKALDIRLKELPTNHADIGDSYNNIGYVYFLQGNFIKSLQLYQKALAINLISLSINHPDLSTTYNNIGTAHYGEQNYTLAIEYYEKAIEIDSKSLPSNHPDFVQTFNSLAHSYALMKNHSKALEYFEKALNIEQARSRPSQLLLSKAHANVGCSCESMDQNSMALDHYKAALRHGLKVKPRNHSHIHVFRRAIKRCINRAEQLAIKAADDTRNDAQRKSRKRC